MTFHEKWEKIDHRLRALDAADQEKEVGLLSEAYERLISAYQEAREINDELEELIKIMSCCIIFYNSFHTIEIPLISFTG